MGYALHTAGTFFVIDLGRYAGGAFGDRLLRTSERARVTKRNRIGNQANERALGLTLGSGPWGLFLNADRMLLGVDVFLRYL